ncbi:hypothetical protein MSAN_02404300 [Mycena sanguinolenta]|uniref:Uncharacterized protein n=1 Tax=Mycena sanguinolenta TaxID=230812 RepID=A0A8H6X3R3_9AGAR|nr:hypothetical protein MSAN_02404300 [Mycena sanguinolenta]
MPSQCYLPVFPPFTSTASPRSYICTERVRSSASVSGNSLDASNPNQKAHFPRFMQFTWTTRAFTSGGYPPYCLAKSRLSEHKRTTLVYSQGTCCNTVLCSCLLAVELWLFTLHLKFTAGKATGTTGFRHGIEKYTISELGNSSSWSPTLSKYKLKDAQLTFLLAHVRLSAQTIKLFPPSLYTLISNIFAGMAQVTAQCRRHVHCDVISDFVASFISL